MPAFGTVEVRFNKVPQLSGNLRKLAGQKVEDAALEHKSLARSFARVDTGEMRDSIQEEKIGDLAWDVAVGAAHGIFNEHGTVHMGAQPFMTPATEIVRRHRRPGGTMIETTRVDEWLLTTLAASASLTALVSTRIYGYVAPQNSTGNMVIFNWMGGSDLVAVSGYRALVNGLWQVKAITQSGSFAQAKAIMDIVDGLIHRTTGSTSDSLILSCVREAPVQYVEVTNGIQYRHLGGLFRIQISAN
jgi:HK97 gp10 family phage protein